MTELSWSGKEAATIDRVWEVLSDTDAFNRVAGLGYRFTVSEGVVRGEATTGGVTTRWTERPFRWLAPRWFESVRAFDGGPVAEARVRCDLEEMPSGTSWTYTVQLVPRMPLLKPVVAGIARLAVAPKIERALDAARQAIQGEASWDPPPALSDDASRRLDASLRWVPEAVALALRKRIGTLPLHTQAALRPLEIARQEGWNEEDALEGFMLAVKGEALRLSWRVICPQCRTTSIEAGPLPEDTITAHCDTCGIDFDGTVADNIEAIFSVHRSIRPDVPPMDCLLSPRWTPHVVLQLNLAGSGDVPQQVRLQTGCYRVEVPGVGSCWVEVDPEEASTEASLVVGSDVSPSIVRLKPGTCSIRVRNRRPRPVQVQLVRRWRPPFVLSAARLLATPQARVLVPEALLVPGHQVVAGSAWAVVIHGPREDLDGLTSILPDGLQWHRARSRLLVCSVVSTEGAMGLAESMVRGGGPVSLGLAHGVVVRLDRTGALGGPAVDAALALLQRVGRPRVVVGVEDATMLTAALEERAGRVGVVARHDVVLLAFGSMLEAPETPAPADYRATTVPEDLPVQIGPYRVLREIDRGGMGQVFEALDPEGERVAVKIILPEVGSSKALQQRFFNESWYAERIRDPNVVEVREFGLHEERPWLAMEFLVGRTLQHELKRTRRMSPEVAADLLDGVLKGLSALHEFGLVHRDLKPANVMVLHTAGATPGGVKLMDFGLVRRAGLHPEEGLMGTPDYMAPEQMLGESIGPHTDVYAVGTMAYRMVVGRLPFRGALMERFVERVDSSVEELPDLHLLGRLEPVVRAALAPAAERPPDAAAMRALLLDSA